MTELVVSKCALAMAGVPLVTLAVIDTETQKSMVNAYTLTLTTVAPLLLAWIAYRQNKLTVKVDKMKEQTDGMNTAMSNLNLEKGIGAGRAEEAAAGMKGETTLGAPLVMAKGTVAVAPTEPPKTP